MTMGGTLISKLLLGLRKTMNRINSLFAIFIVGLILFGCASRPAPRPIYSGNVPPLESGMSRLKITSGKASWVRLKGAAQVGPVFINDRQIWSAAIDEYIIVDLLPGVYELSWTPAEPYKIFTEKRKVRFEGGENRHFACDMAGKGAGSYFGLIGVVASEYLYKSYLEERPMDNPNSILVDYKVLEESPNSPKSSSRTIKENDQQSNYKIYKSESLSLDNSSVYDRLEKLKKMYEGQLITKEEYDIKRKELVKDF